MGASTDQLKTDPLPWLLDRGTPAVRHRLLDRAPDAWVKPGNGYGPRYSGTTWQLIFLDQFGADGSDTAGREG
jgi:hypothetical protein